MTHFAPLRFGRRGLSPGYRHVAPLGRNAPLPPIKFHIFYPEKSFNPANPDSDNNYEHTSFIYRANPHGCPFLSYNTRRSGNMQIYFFQFETNSFKLKKINLEVGFTHYYCESRPPPASRPAHQTLTASRQKPPASPPQTNA